MDFFAIVVIQVLYGIASLVIISAGLAVIFGMMKVINLAHGEFMMLGAYATLGALKLGINLWWRSSLPRRWSSGLSVSYLNGWSSGGSTAG